MTGMQTGTLAIRRLMLRTHRSRLRVFWGLCYRLATRVVVNYLRAGSPGCAVFVRGSHGRGAAVFGVSDIDLAVVVPEDMNGSGDACERIERRWRRLARAVPPLGRFVEHVDLYRGREFEAATSATYFSYGLDVTEAASPADRAVILGEGAIWRADLLARPGLDGPATNWLLMAGSDPRRRRPKPESQLLRIAAWLELQLWWRRLFLILRSTPGLETPWLCVRLVAEPARIALRLERGESPADLSAVLARALEALPGEETALQFAARLNDALPSCPQAPIDQALDGLVGLSVRIAHDIETAVLPFGTTNVALVGWKPRAGGGPAGAELPYVDWRSLVAPTVAEERLLPAAGDPADRRSLERAIVSRGDASPAFRKEGLLVLPVGGEAWRNGALRAVQCRPSDPVSFALLEGRVDAPFPDVEGWSARDSARRAVAEHRAWLSMRGQTIRLPHNWAGPQPPSRVPTVGGLGLLLSAARAALFLQSLDDGQPALAVTLEAVVQLLGEASSAAGSAAAAAVEEYRRRRAHSLAADLGTFEALRTAVLKLPSYA